MKNSLIFFLSCIVCLSGATQAQLTDAETRSAREIKMAEHAILMSLILARNPASQYLCAQDSYACLGVDQGELGLTVLGNKLDRDSTISLVNLIRFRLDGSLGEDFDCYLLARGMKTSAYVQKTNPTKLANVCMGEVVHIKETNRGKFADLDPAAVCAGEAEIRERAKELLISLRKGSKCAAGDF